MSAHRNRPTPDQAAALARRDKQRIVLMVVGLVVLAGSYFFARTQQQTYGDEEGVALPAQDAIPTEHVVVPEFDVREVLDEVRDASEQDRLVVEAAPLNAVFDYGRLFTRRHYDAVGIRDLDVHVIAEIAADPPAQRVAAFRVRGELLQLKKRRRSEMRPEEFVGTLRLSDASLAHFVVLEVPDGTEVGDYLRIDGFFLKLYRREGSDTWWEGPLICGAEAVRSYAEIDFSAPISLDALGDVRDDTLEEKTGLSEDAKWQLLALARADALGHPAFEVDWDSAPSIDGELLADLFANPDAHRGKPFRLDISRNLGGRTLVEGENPLRLAKITTGWVGNQYWKSVPAFHYLLGEDRPELQDRNGVSKLLVGRGFFFKNMSYEKRTGDIGRTPVFVMSAVEVFEPQEDTGVTQLMWYVVGGSIGIAALLWYLLMTDKKKSRELQDELIRRRRARRAKTATATGDSAQ